MTDDIERKLQTFIEDYLRMRLRDMRISGVEITGDLNMIDTGIINSMGFIELVADIEEEFAVDVDFEHYRPEELSTVTGLVECVMNGAKGESA